MRRLLYVPILHDEADMGSAGKALARESVALSGRQRWLRHKEVTASFWASIRTCLLSFDPHRLTLYQDGLAAEGELGRRIVEEAARKGSSNYRLVLELVDKGAQLRKTEDPILLLRERDNITSRLRQQPAGDAEQYRRQRDRLTEERDRFIAETINASLREGEIGVLFIGAYHVMASRLAADTSVVMVKERTQIQAYLNALFTEEDEMALNALALYLTAPIGITPGGSFPKHSGESAGKPAKPG